MACAILLIIKPVGGVCSVGSSSRGGAWVGEYIVSDDQERAMYGGVKRIKRIYKNLSGTSGLGSGGGVAFLGRVPRNAGDG